MEKIKIALIGAGSMGKTYAEMIDGGRISSLTLAAVCCRGSQSKQWAKENLSSEAVIFDSTEAMYEEAWRFDAVLIVTPHRTHPQLAIQAFEHGKHVFCDKPSGVSLLQCRAMNEAAEASGKKFAMMFHQRLYRKYNRIKTIIGSGELGKISRVLLENSRYFRTARYHQSADWRSSWSGKRRRADQPGAAYSGYVAVAVRYARGCLRPDPLWKV
ncbi:MAG: Gfo/Idh/MocA family oxidoreductase [Lacrimispora sp.]